MRLTAPLLAILAPLLLPFSAAKPLYTTTQDGQLTDPHLCRNTHNGNPLYARSPTDLSSSSDNEMCTASDGPNTNTNNSSTNADTTTGRYPMIPDSLGGIDLCELLDGMGISCVAYQTMAFQPEKNLMPRTMRKCVNCSAHCLKELKASGPFIQCLQKCSEQFCQYGK